MSFQGQGQRDLLGRGSRGNRRTGSNRGRSRNGYNARNNDDVDALSASLRSLSLRYSNPSQSQNQRASNQFSQISRIPAQLVPAGRPVRVVSAKEINDYVHQIVDGVSPSQYELDMKKEMCVSLQAIVRRVVPNAELKIMGGAANTFALKDSDVDVCIVSAVELGILLLEKLATEFRGAGENSIVQYAPSLRCPI